MAPRDCTSVLVAGRGRVGGILGQEVESRPEEGQSQWQKCTLNLSPHFLAHLAHLVSLIYVSYITGVGPRRHTSSQKAVIYLLTSGWPSDAHTTIACSVHSTCWLHSTA